jgi:hypothetical protein
MEQIEYLLNFEEKLKYELVNLCTSYNMLSGQLLETEDISNRWKEFAPEYIADAIKEIKDYPTVSIAWAGFLGMGVAYYWDMDISLFNTHPYKSYYGNEGFDDLDEQVMYRILRFNPKEKECIERENMIRRCAEKALSMIRHEQIEPQSPMAFHIFARATKVKFHIGAALELKRLGYKFEAVNIPQC